MDLDEHNRIQLLIKSGYIAEDLTPLACTWCGSNDLGGEVKSIDGGMVSESECSCNKCGRVLGYWAYGYWQV